MDENDCYDFEAHSCAITRLRVSYDDNYLMSCAEDGSIWIFRIYDRDVARSRRDKESTYSEEVTPDSVFLGVLTLKKGSG